MEPTHKFNSGNKATLCKSCRATITEDFTSDLLCVNCQQEAINLLYTMKQDAELALDGSWDRTDDGFESQIELINNFLKNIDDEES